MRYVDTLYLRVRELNEKLTELRRLYAERVAEAHEWRLRYEQLLDSQEIERDKENKVWA